MTASMKRLLPIPASPATSRKWPRPLTTPSRRRSARSSRSSRPINSGQRTGPNVVAMASECRASRSRFIGRMTDDGAFRRHESAAPTRPAEVPAPERRPRMAKFMDVHSGFFGVTAEQLKEAHEADLRIEKDEGVHFERAWLDP